MLFSNPDSITKGKDAYEEKEIEEDDVDEDYLLGFKKKREKEAEPNLRIKHNNIRLDDTIQCSGSD